METMYSETSPTTEPATTADRDPASATLDALPARVRDIAALRGLGYTFREIAQPLNITPQAASIMLARYQRSLKSLQHSFELCNLSARAVNVLRRHGITSRDQARLRDIAKLLDNQRNCGRKTIEEIERWMNDGHHVTA